MPMPDEGNAYYDEPKAYEYPTAYSTYIETPSGPTEYIPPQQWSGIPPTTTDDPRPPTKKPWLAVICVGLAIVGLVVLSSVIFFHDSLSSGATTSQSLKEWRASMAPKAREVSNDMEEIKNYADANSLAGVGMGCGHLTDDLVDWESYLPSPDAGVTREMQAGIDQYQEFADLCMHLTLTSTTSDYTIAKNHLEAGNAHIVEATKIMNAQDA